MLAKQAHLSFSNHYYLLVSKIKSPQCVLHGLHKENKHTHPAERSVISKVLSDGRGLSNNKKIFRQQVKITAKKEAVRLATDEVAKRNSFSLCYEFIATGPTMFQTFQALRVSDASSNRSAMQQAVTFIHRYHRINGINMFMRCAHAQREQNR